MDDIDPRLSDIFYEVQRGLPRQGPGDDASTHKALAFCAALPDRPSLLDIGCGPGMQTMALAEATSGQITAVDNCAEYLDELRRKIEASHLSERVTVQRADMAALDFPSAAFDLIWCEGAAYVMGVPEALKAWRPLLRDQGYLAFTELVWLEDTPPAEVAAFFRSEYPAMTNVAAVNASIRENGYEPIADFTLPDSAWWDHYYTPLEAKLPSLRQKYQADEAALGIINTTATEIKTRRRFGTSYGYRFFIARNAR